MLSLSACGPSQKEMDEQKRIDDSLMEKERNVAIDNANALLSDTTTTKDTMATIETKTK